MPSTGKCNVLRGHRESIEQNGLCCDREAHEEATAGTVRRVRVKQGTRVNSLSLVRYRTNDYSVPVRLRPSGSLDPWHMSIEVVIGCGAGNHCPTPPFLRLGNLDDGLLQIRIHYLNFAGAQDRCPGSGRDRTLGADGNCLMPSQPCAVSWRLRMGKAGKKGMTAPGPSACGDLRSRGASRRGEGRPIAPGCDFRLLTPSNDLDAVPYRCDARPNSTCDIGSLPASGQSWRPSAAARLYELVADLEARHDRYAASRCWPKPPSSRP